jgi:hypothetical protein
MDTGQRGINLNKSPKLGGWEFCVLSLATEEQMDSISRSKSEVRSYLRYLARCLSCSFICMYVQYIQHRLGSFRFPFFIRVHAKIT